VSNEGVEGVLAVCWHALGLGERGGGSMRFERSLYFLSSLGENFPAVMLV
jgi:hypothetical protein